jgi:hypothetical protein
VCTYDSGKKAKADDAGAVAITGNVDSTDIAQQAIELAQNVLQTLTSTAAVMVR